MALKLRNTPRKLKLTAADKTRLKKGRAEAAKQAEKKFARMAASTKRAKEIVINAKQEEAGRTDLKFSPFRDTKMPRTKLAFVNLLESTDDNAFYRGRLTGANIAKAEYENKLKELRVEEEKQKREVCIKLMDAAAQLVESMNKMILSMNGHM